MSLDQFATTVITLRDGLLRIARPDLPADLPGDYLALLHAPSLDAASLLKHILAIGPFHRRYWVMPNRVSPPVSTIMLGHFDVLRDVEMAVTVRNRLLDLIEGTHLEKDAAGAALALALTLLQDVDFDAALLMRRLAASELPATEALTRLWGSFEIATGYVTEAQGAMGRTQ